MRLDIGRLPFNPERKTYLPFAVPAGPDEFPDHTGKHYVRRGLKKRKPVNGK
jgi:hypothetical protein